MKDAGIKIIKELELEIKKQELKLKEEYISKEEYHETNGKVDGLNIAIRSILRVIQYGL